MKIPRFLKLLWQKIKKQCSEEHHSTDDPQIIPAHLSTYSYGAIQHHPTTDEIQHRTAERYYWQEQRRLAKELNDLTRALNRITGWGTGVALLGLIALVLTLRETRRQADISEQTLRATQRAAISLGLPDGKFIEVDSLGKIPLLKLYFRNYGAQTARDTHIEIWPFLPMPGKVGIVDVPPVPIMSTKLRIVGMDIPPGFQHTELWGSAGNTWEAITSGSIYFKIIGRISYRDELRGYCDTFSAEYAPAAKAFRLRGGYPYLCDGKSHRLQVAKEWEVESNLEATGEETEKEKK